MARLPGFLWFLRPCLHQFRRVLRALIGLESVRTTRLPDSYSVELPVGEAFHRVMDRICILESLVNWRLYGMPAALGNIKLEQAAILAGSVEVEKLLKELAPKIMNPAIGVHYRESLKRLHQAGVDSLNLKTLVCGDYSLAKEGILEEFAVGESKSKVLADTEDLFLITWRTGVSRNVPLVEAPILTVLAAQEKGSLDFIWLSDAADRQSALKWLLALRQAAEALKVGGVIAGVFATEQSPYVQADPRRFRLVEPDAWALALPSNIEFSHDRLTGTYVLRKKA